MKTGYLTTTEVSRMLKVNESSVKRWTDKGNLKCMKTPGGHRKYTMKDVVEFMDKFSYDTTETLIPSQKTMSPVVISTDYAILMKDYTVLSDMFYNTVLTGNRENTFQFLSMVYANRFVLADICDKIIFPAFQKIGNKWMMRELGIEQEHLATNTAIHALYKMQEFIHKKQKNRKIVLAGCLEGEYHELGLLCAANALEAEGWTLYNLGVNVPTDSFVNAIENYQPQIILASSTTPKTKKQLIETSATLHRTAREHNGALIIGGYATQDKIRSKISADCIPANINEVLRFAHQLGVT